MENDRQFLERFRSADIPREEWTHEAHLRMAYLHLRRYDFRDAVRRIRRGIRRLNRANRVVDSEAGGYHETLTLAWARLVAAGIAGLRPDADFAAFIARNPGLLARDRVLDHYSRERIDSARARREFVLPDRAPLPAEATNATVRNRSPRRKDSAVAPSDDRLRSTQLDLSRRIDS